MATENLILIVDDTATARDILDAFLRALNYQIAFACDGPEAIAKAVELTPDLILLDVMMPGMDGFEVCRRIRAHHHLAEVPIILVTALDDRSSRLQGLAAGADDFLSKPVDVAELRARVNTVMRLNRYRRLLEQRSRFEWVVEQAGDGYLTLGRQGEVLYTNPSARYLLELADEVIMPTTALLRDLISGHFRYEPAEIWSRWFDEKEMVGNQVLYLIRPESSVAPSRWIEVRLHQQLNTAHHEQLVHLRDVTAQRSTQRDTWTFHSMIMHKLNTPLQTMLGSLEMLSAEYLTKLSAQEVIDLARYAYKGGQRLSSTITDILQYLKAPVIAHTGEGVRIDELSTLIEQIGGALGITLQITCQVSAEDQRLILARRAVECMLWELLENTQKFHPDHQPQVEVVMADTATNRLKLSVMDDGVNLSLEQIAKAWSPYYQGEKYHTGEIPGVGLGLSMVAALVWETGGECQLRNRTDRPGVIVDLTLPLG